MKLSDAQLKILRRVEKGDSPYCGERAQAMSAVGRTVSKLGELGLMNLWPWELTDKGREALKGSM